MNLFLSGLFLLGAGGGQGTPAIAGVVVDSSGSVVPGAAVTLEVPGVPVNEVRGCSRC